MQLKFEAQQEYATGSSLSYGIVVFRTPVTVTARKTWWVHCATHARLDFLILRQKTLTAVKVYIFVWHTVDMVECFNIGYQWYGGIEWVGQWAVLTGEYQRRDDVRVWSHAGLL